MEYTHTQRSQTGLVVILIGACDPECRECRVRRDQSAEETRCAVVCVS